MKNKFLLISTALLAVSTLIGCKGENKKSESSSNSSSSEEKIEFFEALDILGNSLDNYNSYLGDITIDYRYQFQYQYEDGGEDGEYVISYGYRNSNHAFYELDVENSGKTTRKKELRLLVIIAF